MDDIDTFLFLHRIDTMSHLVARPLSDPSLEEEKKSACGVSVQIFYCIELA